MEFWHVFTGTRSDSGEFVAVVVGPSERGPDEQIESGILVRELVIPQSLGLSATWTAVFDHEPTDEEKAALAPDATLTVGAPR